MNLTGTMAKNPQPFLDAARKDQHARHAAILACGSKEDLYLAARGMGLSDQEIIANANAETHEKFDSEAWANGEYATEVADDFDHSWDAKMRGMPSADEVSAIMAFVESQDC